MRASSMPATSRPSCSTSRRTARSHSTGTTRSRRGRAWRARRGRHEPRPAADVRDHDPRTGDLPRVRGDLEGADAAAHAAHVGHERDPRHRDRRCDARRRRRSQGHADDDHRARRRRARLGERRRRLRRHRPDARDVQEAGAQRARRVSREATNLLYLVTIVTFVLALRFLSNPATARRGNQIGAIGMLVAIVVTFAQDAIMSYWEIGAGMAVGGTFGAIAARRVRMTAMPQMVALFNGVGGGAAALISLAEFHNLAPDPGTLKTDISASIVLSAIIGSISFAGSMIAFEKLQELIGGRPIVYPLQQATNALLFLAIVAAGIAIAAGSERQWLIWALVLGSLLFGVLFVLPIGGADMPVVISLLNAFTGLAAAATGFELENNVLIVSGMLVGASGTMLTILMGRAMNRSIANVLFGAFGQLAPAAASTGGSATNGDVRSASPEDVAVMLAYAQKVVFVPGYGMAVAQAQHDVRALADLLESRGVEVSYAIHPVAGRMPGHMNVLLAEANVPYPQLKEMDDANNEFPRTDVALVIGANDVVNPDARNNQGSPIYGMPILNVDQSQQVVVLKRSMNPGFAGIENPLFLNPKTVMLFGDAKSSVEKLAASVKAV